VFLIDADLRKPKIHKLLGLNNDLGLADVLSAPTVNNWNATIKEAGRISVLTAGQTPSDPAGLLSSRYMNVFLSEVEKAADILIVDGPPFFVADAMILASKVDGVLVVVRPGHTRQTLAKTAVDQIKLVGARVIGIVLNRIPLRGADYYVGKSYLYTYQLRGDEREGKEKKFDRETLREILLPYANKAPQFIQHIFEAVFKLSPK
jgi:capsular exopolysaccharide synthesis family protein